MAVPWRRDNINIECAWKKNDGGIYKWLEFKHNWTTQEGKTASQTLYKKESYAAGFLFLNRIWMLVGCEKMLLCLV